MSRNESFQKSIDKPILVKRTETKFMSVEQYDCQRYVAVVHFFSDGLSKPVIRFISKDGLGPEGEILSTGEAVASFQDGPFGIQHLDNVRENIESLLLLVAIFKENKGRP